MVRLVVMTDLPSAIRKGDALAVRGLEAEYDDGSNPTVNDPEVIEVDGRRFNRYPLIEAVITQNYAALEILFARPELDLTIRDEQGMTPLHHAAVRNLSIVNRLLDRKAPVNSQDDRGRTPLHLAVQWKLKDIVHALLNAGADINLAAQTGENVLNMAARTGDRDLVELFLKRGVPLDFENTWATDYSPSLNIIFEFLWNGGQSPRQPEILKLKTLALKIYAHGNQTEVAADLLKTLQSLSFAGSADTIVTATEMQVAEAQYLGSCSDGLGQVGEGSPPDKK